MISKLGESEVKCKGCNETLYANEEFKLHIQDPLNSLYVCVVCTLQGNDNNFTSQCKLNRHVKNEHNTEDTKSDSKEDKCSSCGVLFDTMMERKNHENQSIECMKINQLESLAKIKKMQYSS